MAMSRLFGVVSATKLRTSSGPGILPTRSKLIRRKNSSSVVSRAVGMRRSASVPKIASLMKFRRGMESAGAAADAERGRAPASFCVVTESSRRKRDSRARKEAGPAVKVQSAAAADVTQVRKSALRAGGTKWIRIGQQRPGIYDKPLCPDLYNVCDLILEARQTRRLSD